MRRPRFALWAMGILVLACYAYVMPRWADPNQNSRIDMVLAVVDDGTLYIDKYVHNTVDYAKVGDHYYSDKAPGVAFLGIAAYAAVRPLLSLPWVENRLVSLAGGATLADTYLEDGQGVTTDRLRFAAVQVMLAFLFAAVPSALVVVLVATTLLRSGLSWTASALAALGYGLLSPALAYANAFYGHQLAAALLFGAFYLLFSMDRPPSNTRLAAIGTLLGYAVITEYPAALIAGLLGAMGLRLAWRTGRAAAAASLLLPAGLIVAGWMTYNAMVFGGPLALGYTQSELWQDQHHTGFMSLTLPSWEALWGIIFSPFRGLLFLSPWLALSIPGAIRWARTRAATGALAVSVLGSLGFVLFNASSVMWWGGFAIGPRYLLPALPFMAVLAGWTLDRLPGGAAARVGITALLVWSGSAVWMLTLAGQAFPPDTVANPLVQYAGPRLLAGDVARNLGTLAGLSGVWSLVPLGLLPASLVATVVLVRRRGPVRVPSGTDTLRRPVGFPLTNGVGRRF